MTHLQLILNKCAEYGTLWKINFNPKKSVVMCLNNYGLEDSVMRDFYLKHTRIETAKDLIYLSLPIGLFSLMVLNYVTLEKVI